MSENSDSALLLAAQLRSLDDEALTGLLTARSVRTAGITDFFDLAEALLEQASVLAALARLDRSTLIVLMTLAERGTVTLEQLSSALSSQRGGESVGNDSSLRRALAIGDQLALLIRSRGVITLIDPAARQLLAPASSGLPSRTNLINNPAPATLSPASARDTRRTDRGASERAFSTVLGVAELISACDREPARELNGSLALSENKRLAAELGVGGERVSELFAVADRAGLVSLSKRSWMPSDAGIEWLLSPFASRWSSLAQNWLMRLPDDIRTLLADRSYAEWGEPLERYATWLYPASGLWMRKRITAHTGDAELLGITTENAPSTPGTALLTSGITEATEAMAALFPTEVEQVYLQNDLSIVSPGPLAPRLDARLRGLADSETRAIANSYRVSAASLTRAMTMGETEHSIRDFLTAISLTGIPQPLDYLIREAQTQHGLIRVLVADEGSRIRSRDAAILRTLAVDQSLAPLRLTPSGNDLLSRFPRDTVFWGITEARYPVAAEEADGTLVIPRHRSVQTEHSVSANPVSTLIETLRHNSSDTVSGQGAWLARQLDIAIRGKNILTITVRMPDGSMIDYRCEPLGVAHGRLRTRDRTADLERTLPLSSIVAIEPDGQTPHAE